MNMIIGNLKKLDKLATSLYTLCKSNKITQYKNTSAVIIRQGT